MGSKDELETLTYPELLQINKTKEDNLKLFLKQFQIGGVGRQEQFWIESRIIKPQTGSRWSLSNWRAHLPSFFGTKKEVKQQTKIKWGLEELQLQTFIDNSKSIMFNWGDPSNESQCVRYEITGDRKKLLQFVRMKVINVLLSSANIYDPSFKLVDQKMELPSLKLYVNDTTTELPAVNGFGLKSSGVVSNQSSTIPFRVIPFRPSFVYQFFGGNPQSPYLKRFPFTFQQESFPVDTILDAIMGDSDDDEKATRIEQDLQTIQGWYEVYQKTFKSDIMKQLVNLNLDLRYVFNNIACRCVRY